MFPGTNAYADAAAGYDAVHLLSNSMDHFLANSRNPDFTADDVDYDLNAGVMLPGESGLIELGSTQKYPANKGVYINKLTSDGTLTIPMTCGNLQVGQAPATTWTEDESKPSTCPKDQ
jgi:hypothetical protein